MPNPTDLFVDQSDSDSASPNDEVLERISREILEGNRYESSADEEGTDNKLAESELYEDVDVEEITCSQCKTLKPWNGSSWCPECGYYPTLNTSVQLADEREQELAEEASKNLLQSIPRWAWELLIGLVAIVGASLFARFSFAAGSPTRAWWAVSQAAIGEIVYWVIHFRVFFYATMSTDRYGPLAWFMNPVDIWKPTLSKLPKMAWRIKLAVWGQVAVLCALVLVGGLDYSGLFKEDWGVKGNANSGLLQAIAKKEAEDEGADNLEGALNDFTEETDEEPEIELPRADCVVFGYTQIKKDEFHELLLASQIGSKLTYVGKIYAADINAENREEINKQIKQTKRCRKPLVRTVHSGFWLEPRVMVEVEYEELTSSNRFEKLKLHALLKFRE